MTVLDRTKIPAAINTYERILGWAAMSMQNILNRKGVNVVANAGEDQQCQCNYVRGADGQLYIQVVAYLPYDEPILFSSAKPWMAVMDIATAAPHINFTSD
jgi:hypothetical protein